MNWLTLLTSWQVLLPLSLVIGPLLSYAGLDSLVHRAIIQSGGGVRQKTNGRVFKALTWATDAIPVGLVVSSLLFQPMQGGWKLAVILLSVATLKFIFGRPYISEYHIDKFSRLWAPVWGRKVQDWKAEGSRLLRYAYPSGHTSAVLGCVLLGLVGPTGWLLLGLLVGWFVYTSRHWFSDIVGGLCCTAGMVSLLGA